MKFESQVSEMQGAYSAIFTPFDSSGEINFDMLTEIANFQLSNGIQGFFAAGSTGEGLLLSFEERCSVIRHLASNFSERATIIANVGHTSTEVAVELAQAACDAGANWISSVPPIYHGTTFDGAMRHYATISNATNLPFMIYALDGHVDPIRDVAVFDLPNVCGMKYTGANYFSAQQLSRNVDRPIALMSGFDEQFVACQLFGFQGGIGSTFNFAPDAYARMFDLCKKNDYAVAAQLQEQVNEVTHLTVQYQNWSYRKAIMKYIGFDCGSSRLPYAPLSDSQYQDFADQLGEFELLRVKADTRDSNKFIHDV